MHQRLGLKRLAPIKPFDFAMLALRPALIAIALLTAPVAKADLYFCKSADGSFHFSRTAGCGETRVLSGDGHERAYRRPSAIPQNFQAFRPYFFRPYFPAVVTRPTALSSLGAPIRDRSQFALAVEQLARVHKVDPRLVHAVIANESGYNPNAVSPAGAVGLMQLMPGTASRYGVASRTDPRANIAGGVRYLSDLLRMFNGDLSLALAAYNAGENAVIGHGYKVPPYAETRSYVRKVLSSYGASRGRISDL